MSVDVIDRLIFALDGDLTGLNAQCAQAEVSVQKTSSTIQSSMTDAFKKVGDQATTQSAKVRASLAEIETSGRKAASVWETTAQSIARSTNTMVVPKSAQDSWQTFGAALGDIKTPAEKLRLAMLGAGDGAEHLGNHVNISRRELVYLVREMATGDFQRAPTTIALMASHFLGVSGAAIAAGAGIAALPVALAVSAVRAEESLAKLRTSLILTGNASGLSLSQAANAAAQIAAAVPMSGTGAREFVGGLVGTVPGPSITQAGIAAGNYSMASGAKTEESQKIIRDIFNDPSKAAEELNSSMHLLNTEQMREIETLQKSGESQKAAQLVLDAFSERAKEAAESASALDRAMANASSKAGGFMLWAARMVGAGQSDLDRYRDLSSQRALAVRQYNTGDLGRKNEIDRLDKQMSVIAARMTADREANYAKGFAIEKDKLVGEGVKESDMGAGAFTKHLEEMDEAIAKADKSVQAATVTHSKELPVLEAQAAALRTARQYQKSPAQIAADEAADQHRLANTPQESLARVTAEMAAKRTYERNLADPRMVPFAASIYASDRAKARDNSGDAELRRRQNQNLKDAGLQADDQMKLADAYSLGGKAVAALTAAQQAHEAVAKRTIRASQETAYAVDLQTKAFAEAAKAVAEKVSTDQIANQGLARLVAANGDPAAIARAKAENEALAITAKERDNALTKDQIALAEKHLNQLRQEFGERDRQNMQIETAADIVSRRREVGDVQGQIRAVAGGADVDDMRHLEVQQRTIEDLIRRGYDPATAEFQKQLRVLLPLNQALSDATDHLGKMRQEASELAGGITGPFKDFLRGKGEVSPVDMLAQMGENTLDTLVQHELIDPMQKGLEGVFGSALGTPKDLLGATPATPMYVQDVASLLGGAGGGGGGLGGLLNLFGGDSGAGGIGEAFGGGDFIGTSADAAGGADFLSTLLSFAGMFDEGGTIGPGQWGIKSGMPEIIQGGMQGVSILPLNAPVVRAATGAAGRGAGVNSNPGGPGNGGSSDQRVIHNWNISTPQADSFIRSRSQIEARFTMAAARGQRNS